MNQRNQLLEEIGYVKKIIHSLWNNNHTCATLHHFSGNITQYCQHLKDEGEQKLASELMKLHPSLHSFINRKEINDYHDLDSDQLTQFAQKYGHVRAAEILLHYFDAIHHHRNTFHDSSHQDHPNKKVVRLLQQRLDSLQKRNTGITNSYTENLVKK